MGWGRWVWVGLALAIVAVVGVLLVTHLTRDSPSRVSLYYVGYVGYLNVYPMCPSVCAWPAVSPNAPLIVLRPYRIETVTVGNRTVMRFIGLTVIRGLFLLFSLGLLGLLLVLALVMSQYHQLTLMG